MRLLAIAIGILAALALPAHAQEAAAREVVAAAEGSPVLLVVALSLVVTVWLLRIGLASRIAFFATGAGGVVLSTLVSLAGAIGSAVVAGVPVTPQLLAGAVAVSVMGSGVWSQGKAAGEHAAKPRKRKPRAAPGFSDVWAIAAIVIVWVSTMAMLVLVRS